MAKQALKNAEIEAGEDQEQIGEENLNDGAQDELEARARRMGWHPKDDYNGPAGKWVDAKTFIERSETELPILRERLRSQDRALSQHQAKLGAVETRLNDTLAVVEDMRQLAHNAETRSYNRAKRELEQQMQAAVDAADTAGYVRAKAEFDALQAPPAAPVKKEVVKEAGAKATPTIEPEVAEWVSANNWFNVDPVLNAMATALHGQYLKEHPGLSLPDNLAKVKEECQRRFPDKFGITRKATTPAVNEGGSGRDVSRSTNPKKKGYNDLPAEAKRECDRFVKAIPKYTREEFCETYFAGEDE